MTGPSPSLLRRGLKAILPVKLRLWLTTAQFYYRYGREYGHIRSRLEQAIVAKDGSPLPWYCYPAIEYLDGLDFSNSSVFEYGCGQSTLYWSQRARQVTSVEHDAGFYEHIKAKVPANATLLLVQDDADYVATVGQADAPFDVIVIDGLSRTRSTCAARAVRHLAPGGLIILDNAERYPEACRYLRDQDLIEVDMHGPVPMGTHTSTTSLFFSRQFAVRPRTERLPIYSRCAAVYRSQHDRYPADVD